MMSCMRGYRFIGLVRQSSMIRYLRRAFLLTGIRSLGCSLKVNQKKNNRKQIATTQRYIRHLNLSPECCHAVLRPVLIKVCPHSTCDQQNRRGSCSPCHSERSEESYRQAWLNFFLPRGTQSLFR